MAGGDWLQSVQVGSNGMATAIITHQNASAVWEIEQVSVTVGPNSTTGNVAIYKNGNLVAPTSLLVPQVAPAGNQTTVGQTAAGLPYAYIQASDQLQIVISGAASGDHMNVRAQIREYPLSDPAVRGR